VRLYFFSYLLRLRRYKAKGVKTRCYQEGVGQFERRFQGGDGSSLGNIFWFLQNQTHFAIGQCKLHHATCRRFDTIPASNGRTDGQTGGIGVATAALAKRRAVKRRSITPNKNSIRAFQRAIYQGSTPPLTFSKWG